MQNHILGRAFFCLLGSKNIGQANTQFNYILNQSYNNLQALLGKALITYYRKDYTGALIYFKQVMRSNPKCPANVRLGMAHCHLKLGNNEKAQLVFERVLQLDPKCVAALVGLALMNINSQTLNGIQLGVNMLSKAYSLDPTNPLVLNHLSNHFFFKKDYFRSEFLAKNALQSTDIEAIRAESCYLLGRIYHVQVTEVLF